MAAASLMDYERGRLRTGFAKTLSVGDGAADARALHYAMGSTVTTVLPYARINLTRRLSAWGLAGTGSGRLTLDLDGRVSQSYRTDLSMTLAATGGAGRAVVARGAGRPGAGAQGRRVLGAHRIRRGTTSFGSLMGTRGQSSRLPAVLDGSSTFTFAGGATPAPAPTAELGLRHDGGDAETGTGLELGAGVGYTDPSLGLDMALRVHGLTAHAEDRCAEWGVSGSFRLVPGGSGRGLSALLTPSYGVDPGGSERLWALPDASGLAPSADAVPSSRLDAELGYGLALPGGFTGVPNVSLGLSDTVRDWRVAAVRGSAAPAPDFRGGLRDHGRGWRKLDEPEQAHAPQAERPRALLLHAGEDRLGFQPDLVRRASLPRGPLRDHEFGADGELAGLQHCGADKRLVRDSHDPVHRAPWVHDGGVGRQARQHQARDEDAPAAWPNPALDVEVRPCGPWRVGPVAAGAEPVHLADVVARRVVPERQPVAVVGHVDALVGLVEVGERARMVLGAGRARQQQQGCAGQGGLGHRFQSS